MEKCLSELAVFSVETYAIHRKVICHLHELLWTQSFSEPVFGYPDAEYRICSKDAQRTPILKKNKNKIDHV